MSVSLSQKGRVDFFFGPVGLVLPLIRDGKLHPNVRAGYCYSVVPWPESWINHSAWVTLNHRVPGSSLRPKPSKPSSIGNRPFLRGYSTAWFGFFGL
jgi:hypothetical protein